MSLLVRVLPDRAAAERLLVDELAALLAERARAGGRLVLCLPTGASPQGSYAEIVRRHRERRLSLAAATVVLLDEYWPLQRGHPASFRRFLDEHLLDHVDVPATEVLALDGHTPEGEVEAACAHLEAELAARGGIDWALLGIGRNGHIGFNEPGSPAASRTRRVTLHEQTRADAAAAHPGGGEVPRQALTLGLGTLLEARSVRVLAFGTAKAAIVARAIEGPPGEQLPASLLHRHADAAFLLDGDAAGCLVSRRPTASS